MGVTQQIVVGASVKPHGNKGGWRGVAKCLDNLTPYHLQTKCLRCNRPVMSGKRFCQWHGKHGVPNPSRERIQARALDMMAKLGLLPPGLVALPVWQQLARKGMMTRAPLQMALVLSWHRQEHEPMAWAAAWRNACKACGG